MSTSPQQEDAFQYDALSEPVSPGDASSAPLSQYLKAGVDAEDDGWTVFSSGETEKTASKRPRDLSVLKSIKRFLNDEASQENASPSSSDGGAYRVDYPFYDGEPEPQARESSAVEYAYDEQLTLEPSGVRYETLSEPKATYEEPQEPKARVEEKYSSLCQELDEPESVETLESCLAKNVETEPENASEELGFQEFGKVVDEDLSAMAPKTIIGEEIVIAEPCVESESSEESADAPGEKTFIFDCSDIAKDAFERLDQGLEAPEPPLVVSNGKSSRKRESELFVQQEQLDEIPLTIITDCAEQSFVRRNRETPSRLTIFRHFVGLFNKRREEAPRDVKTNEPTPVKEPEALDSADVDYGQTVAFAIAPCFTDAKTFSSLDYSSPPQ